MTKATKGSKHSKDTVENVWYSWANPIATLTHCGGKKVLASSSFSELFSKYILNGFIITSVCVCVCLGGQDIGKWVS